MMAVLVLLAAAAAGRAAERKYELEVHVAARGVSAVSVWGSRSPFLASGLTGFDGKIRFKGLLPGAYTVSAYRRSGAEAQRTIEVGPSAADSKGRVRARLEPKQPAKGLSELSKRRAIVSAKDLSVPDKAHREYQAAQKCLERRDVEGANRRLEKAVEIAPQFSAAWNTLGTIAYQTRRLEDAERYFREALRQNQESFEAQVNLGGTLLTMGRYEQSMEYNLAAVQRRPEDALAQSQVGMNYFHLGKLDLAEKHLKRAKQIDPAHFSHPQRVLAELYARRGQPRAAADELEDLLKHHPDFAGAVRVRASIEKLREAGR